jgi:very-short-patch-repair endonuclease
MDHGLPRVVTLQQAATLGLTESAVRHRLATGRWQRVYRDVYVTHSGPLAPQTRLLAALAYAGDGAALSHETAAVRLGLLRTLGSPCPVVHLTVPWERRVMPQPGLEIHYARNFTESDTRVRNGLRCTSVERTVVDLVSTARTPGRAAALVLDAVGSRKTTSARLRRAMQRTGRPRRHRQLTTTVLAEAQAGAHSPLELRFVEVCRAHGVPEGARQVRQVVRGRTIYVDNIVEEYGLVTELDGHAGHDSAAGRFRDLQRDNANVEAGRTPVRVGWESVLDEPCEVARQRGAILRRLGWTGAVTGCSANCAAVVRVDDAPTATGLTKAS